MGTYVPPLVVAPTPDPVPAPLPVTAAPAVVVKPGDLILVRAISWWDSGQLKRVVLGVLASAGPIIYDLFNRDALTWRSAVNALIGGLFVYIGFSRAKSPDVVTGTKTLDKNNATAFVPSKLLSDLEKREAKAPAVGS